MIEISYLVLFACIFIIGILAATKKMSMGIALTGMGLGLFIAWIMEPYMTFVIGPVGQAILYGSDWTLAAILGLTHLIFMISVVIMAGYNLISSGGKIIWA